eukprot:CAMPEP_0119553116 /NCGR_PEP_ID=MMETSP1352-20130426/5946_1 /TAXON_ID=265584 /ORGANISM="Stauroneis constricta, Strain CCMP1120" /LENGTH=844 /DNA_ID=CAMNT_0007599463 /DNA_START=257 /DNA_END=2787 /DNA_ORIENTATION=+
MSRKAPRGVPHIEGGRDGGGDDDHDDHAPPIAPTTTSQGSRMPNPGFVTSSNGSTRPSTTSQEGINPDHDSGEMMTLLGNAPSTRASLATTETDIDSRTESEESRNDRSNSSSLMDQIMTAAVARHSSQFTPPDFDVETDEIAYVDDNDDDMESMPLPLPPSSAHRGISGGSRTSRGSDVSGQSRSQRAVAIAAKTAALLSPEDSRSRRTESISRNSYQQNDDQTKKRNAAAKRGPRLMNSWSEKSKLARNDSTDEEDDLGSTEEEFTTSEFAISSGEFTYDSDSVEGQIEALHGFPRDGKRSSDTASLGDGSMPSGMKQSDRTSKSGKSSNLDEMVATERRRRYRGNGSRWQSSHRGSGSSQRQQQRSHRRRPITRNDLDGQNQEQPQPGAVAVYGVNVRQSTDILQDYDMNLETTQDDSESMVPLTEGRVSRRLSQATHVGEQSVQSSDESVMVGATLVQPKPVNPAIMQRVHEQLLEQTQIAHPVSEEEAIEENSKELQATTRHFYRLLVRIILPAIIVITAITVGIVYGTSKCLRDSSAPECQAKASSGGEDADPDDSLPSLRSYRCGGATRFAFTGDNDITVPTDEKSDDIEYQLPSTLTCGEDADGLVFLGYSTWMTISGTGNPVRIRTNSAANFDTWIAAYINDCDDLQCIKTTIKCTNECSLTIPTVADQEYRVAIGGIDHFSFFLNIEETETNDCCEVSKRIDLSQSLAVSSQKDSMQTIIAGSHRNATAERGLPCGIAGLSTWYSVTGAGSPMMASTCQEETQSVAELSNFGETRNDPNTRNLTVLTGDCDNPKCVAHVTHIPCGSRNQNTQVTWLAEQGKQYHIVVTSPFKST